MEIQLWREILNPYELAVEELKVKFNHNIKEHRERGLYSPIEQVLGRVKTVTSIIEKAAKKNIPMDRIEEEIEDIAGIRLICQFVEDIYAIADMIKERDDMQVKSVKDYIANHKESGYQSYHMIVMYKIQTLRGPKTIPVEIQIRTLAMNFWATIEHSLQYKYRENMPEYIKDSLSGAATAVIVLDKEMSAVRSEIMDAQNSFRIKANVVASILNTMQNLYKVANKRELVKIQDEFYRIYEQDDLEQLTRFEKEIDLIAEGYKVQGIKHALN